MSKKISAVIASSLIAATSFAAECSDLTKPDYIASFISTEHFEQIDFGRFNTRLYPPFKDRDAWAKAKSNPMLARWYADLMKRVEKIPAIPEMLPHSLYRKYVTHGNRSDYEDKYFKRRRDCTMLVLAMCLTGDREKYLPKIVDYITAIVEESSWCLPAHRKWDGDRLRPFDVCDLFAAETSAEMALTMSIIGDELDDYPGLVERVRSRVLEYVYLPLTPEFQLYHWWTRRPIPNNWVPWCSYNLTLSAICMEKNSNKCAFVIREYMKLVSKFANAYPDNGYCNEGAGYFYHAGGKLFCFAGLLDKIIPGSMDKFYAYPKNRAIFEYIAQVTIGNDLVSYSDAKPAALPSYSVLYGMATKLDSPSLKRFAAAYPLKKYTGGTFMDNLILLFDVKGDFAEKGKAAYADTLYPNQLAVLRSSKFSLAVKAGHNQESHNHNDLGHFSIYNDKTPIIIDAGSGRYEKINFSALRYTIWYVRGSGHNAPVLGGIEQIFGREYTATLPEIKSSKTGKQLVCDLSNAYPEAAGVKRFLRTFDYLPKQVVITDEIQLAKPLPAEISLLTTQKVEVKNSRELQLGNVVLSLEDIDFVSVERISDEKFESSSTWCAPVYRILLRSGKPRYQMKFTSR